MGTALLRAMTCVLLAPRCRTGRASRGFRTSPQSSSVISVRKPSDDGVLGEEVIGQEQLGLVVELLEKVRQQGVVKAAGGEHEMAIDLALRIAGDGIRPSRRSLSRVGIGVRV